MYQPDRSLKSYTSFIKGLLIVLFCNTVFTTIWRIVTIKILESSVFPDLNKNYNYLGLLLPTIFIGVTQIIYLLPTYFFFAKKQRRELCKGLIVGAVATVLLNTIGVIPLFNNDPISNFLSIVATALVPLVLGTIGVLIINRFVQRDR